MLHAEAGDPGSSGSSCLLPRDPYPPHKDKGNSWWSLSSLETPLSYTECPPRVEGDQHVSQHRHPHWWAKAFSPLGLKDEWVHLPLGSAFSKAAQQSSVLTGGRVLFIITSNLLIMLGLIFWDAPAQADSCASPQILLKCPLGRMALGIKSNISTLNCWARVWLELLLDYFTSIEYFCIWVHDFILKSILYLELISHGACRSQHVNDSTTCSVGVMNWKGKCQLLPKNFWKILFLSSCSPLSSTIQLFFGWKSVVTDFGERHQYKQHSLLKFCLIVLSVWKYCSVINLQCSATWSRSGTLKLTKPSIIVLL